MNLPPRTEVKRGITQPWGSHFQHPCSECVDTRYFICRSYFLRPRKPPPRRAAPLLPLQQMNVDKIDLARARTSPRTQTLTQSLTRSPCSPRSLVRYFSLPSFGKSLFIPFTPPVIPSFSQSDVSVFYHYFSQFMNERRRSRSYS